MDTCSTNPTHSRKPHLGVIVHSGLARIHPRAQGKRIISDTPPTNHLPSSFLPNLNTAYPLLPSCPPLSYGASHQRTSLHCRSARSKSDGRSVPVLARLPKVNLPLPHPLILWPTQATHPLSPAPLLSIRIPLEDIEQIRRYQGTAHPPEEVPAAAIRSGTFRALCRSLCPSHIHPSFAFQWLRTASSNAA